MRLPQGAPRGRWMEERSSNCGELVGNPTAHAPTTAVSREASAASTVVRRRRGERKRDVMGNCARVGYAGAGVLCHDDSGSSTGGDAGMDAMLLDLLAHALPSTRDPRDRKSGRLASRAFGRAEAESHRAAHPLRRKPRSRSCLPSWPSPHSTSQPAQRSTTPLSLPRPPLPSAESSSNSSRNLSDGKKQRERAAGGGRTEERDEKR